MEWMKYAVSILSGLAATIPLVIKLIEYVQKATREKNWNLMLDMVIGYMEIAEKKFERGADKKEWVMSMVEQSASTVNYDIDMNLVSNMIDDLCDMSNKINPPAEKTGDEKC